MRLFELKLRLIAPLAVVCCLAGVSSQVAQAQSPPAWVQGDVFAGIGNGQYEVYHNIGTATSPNYVLVETLNQGLGTGDFTTGCTFDLASNLYTTNFTKNDVVKFDANSPHSVLQTINTTGSTPVNSLANESVVFANSGDFFVGHPDGDHQVHRYNASGTFQQAYAVAVETRGSDWIDLSSDQHTLFYTSEGRLVKRFNVSTSTQSADFANLTSVSGTLFALRLLPPGDGSGGLLVTNTIDVKRLDSSGNVVQTYTAPGESSFFALNLDPDGTSFWAGGYFTGKLYKFDIALGGAPLTMIQTGANGTAPANLAGVCVKGQTAAVNTFTQTKTLGPPGTTTTYTYNTDTYKIKGVNNTGGEQLTVTAFLIPASSFPAGFLPSFPRERCIPYADYSAFAGMDTCVEFQATCVTATGSTTPCNFDYVLATSYDLPPDLSAIGGPDFLVAHGQTCPLTTASTVQSIFLSYTVARTDPTTIGGSRGPSCFDATYTAGAPLITTGGISRSQFVGWGSPVDNNALNQVKANSTRPLSFQFFDILGNPVTNLTLCPNLSGTGCTTPWVNLSAFGIVCPNGAPINTATDTTLSFPGNSGLLNQGFGNYQLNWQTQKSWLGSCANVMVTFDSGVVVTPATIGFQFN